MNAKKTFLRMSAIAAISSLAFIGAPAIGAQSDDVQDTLSKYEKTGERVSCLMMRSVRDTDVLDDYTMLFEASGVTYLNELNGRCSGLKREGRYVRQSPVARICKGDIIQVVDSFGTMLGSCSLGEFEKLSPAQ